MWICGARYVFVLLASVSWAQSPQFEVASVRVNHSNGDVSGFPQRSGDRIEMHNTRVYSMIFYAYHLKGAYEIANYDQGPVSMEWYDVDARVPAHATNDQVRLMFQSFLADRFKLKAHRETREIPEYELTPGKGKPKLAESTSDDPMKVTIEGRTLSAPPNRCMGTLWKEGAHVTCHGATAAQIVAEISGALASPLVDHTGLTGKYDFDLLYLPENRRLDDNAPPTPSLEQAVAEQLGLKLQKTKGPVEVLVIDHFEKPSEN